MQDKVKLTDRKLEELKQNKVMNLMDLKVRKEDAHMEKAIMDINNVLNAAAQKKLVKAQAAEKGARYADAFHLYQDLAKEGCVEAYRFIAKYRALGDPKLGMYVDLDEALGYCQKLVEAEDCEFIYTLGEICVGLDMYKDPQLIFRNLLDKLYKVCEARAAEDASIAKQLMFLHVYCGELVKYKASLKRYSLGSCIDYRMNGRRGKKFDKLASGVKGKGGKIA